MPRTATKRRTSKRRGSRPQGPLADSPALCTLADQFAAAQRTKRDSARQRERSEALARADQERRERERVERLRRAREYAWRNSPRGREELRILGLLRRGAGITQILREITPDPADLGDLRTRASHVKELLVAVGQRNTMARGVSIGAGDLARAARFLDELLADIARGVAPALDRHPVWMPNSLRRERLAGPRRRDPLADRGERRRLAAELVAGWPPPARHRRGGC